MRISVLMLGADPVSVMADAQLLREKGLLVITAFNMDNVNELVAEVRPNVVFFDPHEPNNLVADAYNHFLTHTRIPVIYTLADDDVYLVTLGTTTLDERALVTDNIVDAVRIALEKDGMKYRRVTKVRGTAGSRPAVSAMQLFR